MTAGQHEPARPIRPRRRSRHWISFFAVLGLLALAAVAVETWYNLRQQLRAARLQEAQSLWDNKGPASYDVRYTVKRQTSSGDRLLAQMRQAELASIEADGEVLPPAVYPFYDVPGLLGEVEARPVGVHQTHLPRDVDWTAPAAVTVTYAVAVRGGRVVHAEADDQPLPVAVRPYYDMRTLLAGLGWFLERDARTGAPRMYNVASFDPSDGHLLHYVRSSMRTGERLEFILVRLDPVTDNGPTP